MKIIKIVLIYFGLAYSIFADEKPPKYVSQGLAVNLGAGSQFSGIGLAVGYYAPRFFLFNLRYF